MSIRRYLPALVTIVLSTVAIAQDHPPASVYARSSSVSTVDDAAVIVSPGGTASAGKNGFPAFSRPSSETAEASPEEQPSKNMLAIPAVTVTSSLAVVLGLFAAMVWLTRKYGSRSIAPGAIPREVMESLGTTAIDARTRVTMLRCGGRIIVLAQTPTEVRAISEITDPEEVRHLTATCLGDSKREFAIALKSMETERIAPGFAAELETPRQRGRLFATA